MTIDVLGPGFACHTADSIIQTVRSHDTGVSVGVLLMGASACEIGGLTPWRALACATSSYVPGSSAGSSAGSGGYWGLKKEKGEEKKREENTPNLLFK